jgi:hypothetical protein
VKDYTNHRDEDGRFTSGNPGGGRKPGPMLKPLLRDSLDELLPDGRTRAQEMIDTLLAIPLDDSVPVAVRLRALELIIHSVDGRKDASITEPQEYGPIKIFEFVKSEPEEN